MFLKPVSSASSASAASAASAASPVLPTILLLLPALLCFRFLATLLKCKGSIKCCWYIVRNKLKCSLAGKLSYCKYSSSKEMFYLTTHSTQLIFDIFSLIIYIYIYNSY